MPRSREFGARMDAIARKRGVAPVRRRLELPRPVCFVAGVVVTSLVFVALESEPVVVTDELNRVVDMPAGVRWDVRLDSDLPSEVMAAHCEVWGGALSDDGVCVRVDY